VRLRWAAWLVVAPALVAQPAATLRPLVAEARLSDLRWPDFSDYRVHVVKFYEQSGYSLAWVRNGQPTSQARGIIEVLRGADAKGLSAEDYDGSRWPARLARFRQRLPDPGLARFDLALTVSLMRYISDLHIGKLNPRLFHFGFDIEEKKYDLPDLLRERLVNAADVHAVLDHVEPPFPAYQRLQKALQTYLALARQDGGGRLPAISRPLAPGDSYPGLARLEHRLRLTGDLPDAAAAADPATYVGPLVEAVKHFQARHG
jgi:L,D-transpeptidase YcbB